MDITFTILAEQTSPLNDVGDIVHMQSMTGVNYTDPKFRLMHVTGCDGELENLMQYYMQPLRAAVDGEIKNIKDRKFTVAIPDINIVSTTMPFEEFKQLLSIKEIGDG